MKRWENITSQLEIKLTDEMRDDLGLFDDAERLKLRVKHSGYDDPGMCFGAPEDCRPPESELDIHAIEGEVLTAECDETPLSAEQIEIILDGGEVFDAIYQKL